ncbi:hypothetical protein R6H00_09905 [Actinotignum timonense]|nr:hypothetical protein [Actinotignum timonense]MDY5139480.1 hypothetical protein [Actinotignum timonense]
MSEEMSFDAGLVSPEASETERAAEAALRPRQLSEFVGKNVTGRTKSLTR